LPFSFWAFGRANFGLFTSIAGRSSTRRMPCERFSPFPRPSPDLAEGDHLLVGGLVHHFQSLGIPVALTSSLLIGCSSFLLVRKPAGEPGRRRLTEKAQETWLKVETKVFPILRFAISAIALFSISAFPKGCGPCRRRPRFRGICAASTPGVARLRSYLDMAHLEAALVPIQRSRCCVQPSTPQSTATRPGKLVV